MSDFVPIEEIMQSLQLTKRQVYNNEWSPKGERKPIGIHEVSRLSKAS